MTAPMLDVSGVHPALVTPWKHGVVDVDALRALVERMIEGGVSGLIPCGTTGESVTLDDEEHGLVVRTVVEQAAGRVPVLAGAGTVSTKHSIHLAQQAKGAGADGLMLVCPYYNKPTQAGLDAHFRAIVDAVPLPFIIYNIPGRTGVDLTVDTLAGLGDVPELVGIKEATGNVMRSQEILARCGDRFAVLAGDDANILPILAVGGVGVVSVTANAFPAQVCDVVAKWSAGDLAGARAAHLRLLPVHQAMFIETNPGPIKGLLARQGLVESSVRPPLAWPEDAVIDRLVAVCRAAGLEVA